MSEAGAHRALFLFVIGTGRCGSTLLARLLAAHPDLACIAYPRARTRRERLRRRGRDAALPQPTEAYDLLHKEVSPMLVQTFRDLTASDAAPWLEPKLRRFFERRAAQQGRPVFMHKFTGWPRARLLARVFPEARFVHIVRDGRAVANSYVQVGWWAGYRGVPAWEFGPLSEADQRAWASSSYSFTVLAGLEWKILLDAFEAARLEISAERWLDVRYEDLVAHPAKTLESVLEFVGLEPYEGIEDHLQYYAPIGSRADAYRQELSELDVSLLESVIGDHLRRWGYLEEATSAGLEKGQTRV